MRYLVLLGLLTLGCDDDPMRMDAASDAAIDFDSGGIDGGRDAGTRIDAGPPPDSAVPDSAVIDGCTSTAETCNDIDDDCDGSTDENIDFMSDPMNCRTCGTTCDSADLCIFGRCGPDVLRVEQLAAGRSHTCARMSSNQVRCWGANDRGQLGQGDITAHTGIVTVMALENAVWIDAGGDHTCAVQSSGVVKCWGDDQLEQIGDGPGGGASMLRSTPIGIASIIGIETVAAGHGGTCAASPGGSAHCWGSNAWGQIGDGTMMPRPRPTLVMRGATLMDLPSIGDAHACALGRDFTGPGSFVHCWGQNELGGEAGVGNFDRQLVPVETLFEHSEQVETGQQVTCVRTATGGVQCAGNNRRGGLGDGVMSHPDFDVANNFDRSATPVTTALDEVQHLSLAFHHACAVRSDGTVRCWGLNDHGQLGDAVASHAACMTLTATDCAYAPVDVATLTNAARVATGAEHTCALTDDSRVFCWGSNAEGQIGVGGADDRLTPIEIASLAP